MGAADEPVMGRSVARWFSFKFFSLFGVLGVALPYANALQLTVAWDTVAGATGYKVERSTNNLLYTEVASVSTTTYTDSNLSSGAYSYRVRAFNGTATSDYSNVASYASTDVVPAITAQPANQIATTGASATFTVTATASPTPSYQWRKDGVALTGATSSTLTFPSVTSGDAGTYTVVVTNSAGSVTSNGAVLSVTTATTSSSSNSSTSSTSNSTTTTTTSPSASTPTTTTPATTTGPSSTTSNATTPSSRLANASIRATGGLGDQVLIVGFVIDQGDKSVLLRALGPGLAPYTTAATFTDPKLTVYSGSTALATNDNWGGTAAMKTAFKQVGAQSLDDTSKDAALLTTLGPKPYTMVVNGSGPGMTLAEVYDMDATGGRIVNIAARAQVGTGDGVLIAGFVISGNAPKQVLLRGIGPSLARLGVSGALSHPQIDLFHGTTRMDHNEGWGGTSALKAAFTKTGAFALTDPNSSDAALLVTLNPGTYSLIVSSANGDSGVALVEVYDVP